MLSSTPYHILARSRQILPDIVRQCMGDSESQRDCLNGAQSGYEFPISALNVGCILRTLSLLVTWLDT